MLRDGYEPGSIKLVGQAQKLESRIGANLGSVGVERRLLVVLLDSLGVEVDCLGPVLVLESIVALVLEGGRLLHGYGGGMLYRVVVRDGAGEAVSNI